MIKILFLIHDLGPGGAEKVLINLVNNMNKDVFDITVMSLFGSGINEQFLSPDIKYKVIYKKPFPKNSQIMKIFSPELLHKSYIREKYDIEVAYLEGPSARVISGCREPSTKLISWIHVEQHTKKTAAVSFRSFRESEACYTKFNAITAVSESVKHDFQSLYPGKEKVTEIGFSENAFKICGVGKLVPVKGFMKIARIHKRLVDHGYPVHTYILGEGSERKKIERFIKENGIEETFTLLGYQTNPYKFMAKCDVFVCASRAEGFSTAATEAVIVNTPVISTPVSGMEELLGEDPCGVICGFKEQDLYRELKKWICDPALFEKYREKARTRAKKFSQEETVSSTEAFFKSIWKQA